MGDSSTFRPDFEARLEQEKLAALVELAYGAGHEINNPLANIAARRRRCSRTSKIPSGGASSWQFIARRCGPTR